MSSNGKAKKSRRRSLRNLKYHLPAVEACDHPAAADLPCDAEGTVEYGSMWLPGHSDLSQSEKTCATTTSTDTEFKDKKTVFTTSNPQMSSFTDITCSASTLFGNTPEVMRSCQRDESNFFATPVRFCQSVTSISQHEPESKSCVQTPQFLKGHATPESLSILCGTSQSSMVSPVLNYETPSFGCALDSSAVVEDCSPTIMTTSTDLSVLDKQLDTCTEQDPEVDLSSSAITVSNSTQCQQAEATGLTSSAVSPHIAVCGPTVANISPMILGFEFDYTSPTQLSPQQQYLIPASQDLQQHDAETVPKVHSSDSNGHVPHVATYSKLSAAQITSESVARSFKCDTVPELNYSEVQDYLHSESEPLPGEIETESQLSTSMQIKKAKKERRHSFWDPSMDSHADQAHTDIFSEKESRVPEIAEGINNDQIGHILHSSPEENVDTADPSVAKEYDIRGAASQKVKANKRKRRSVDVSLVEANTLWLPVEQESSTSTACQLPLKGLTLRSRRSSLRLYRHQLHKSACSTQSSACADDFEFDAGTTTTDTSKTEENFEANTTSSAMLCEVVPNAKSPDEVGECNTINDDGKTYSVQIAEADEVDILPEVEDLYRNKNYKRPVNKTWETIFELPSRGKLTSKQKFRRYLQFEEVPVSKQKRRWKRAALNGWSGNRLSEIDDSELIVKLDMLQQDIQNQVC